MRNSKSSKPQNVSKYHAPVDKGNRYQKSDQSPHFLKSCHNSSNPFERNGARRSLGADVAPQFDISDYNINGKENSSTNFDSESSVSDFASQSKQITNKRPVQLRTLQTKSSESQKSKSISKSAPASPTKPSLPPRSPHTRASMLNAFNVRTIGNKINISIKKKPNVGLGFTIVTRDNQVVYGSAADIANSVVILVNKILPDGGAAEDNRLRPGDRLLEVNGESVTSLKEATNKLRAIPENENVNLLISRVERSEIPSTEELPLPSTPSSSKRQITVDIPLHQNQKDRQQLGLNILRLNEAIKPPMGPGIYVHSILENSLASQQGSLKVDDKIIAINGKIINDHNVEETICQLKRVMQNDSNLSITVCRTVPMEPRIVNNDCNRSDNTNLLLPNKFSQNKKGRQNPGSKSMPNYSRYSSNDSLSYNNITQPDLNSSFVRESKGRRSMSDKRKAHEDASQYQFYQETRVGNPHIPDERAYSTLPTASRLKKMVNSESPNRATGPVKPSQIKQLNIPKNLQDQIVKPPTRSLSLSTPTKINPTNRSHSPKHLSQTPTHDQQPNFNRSMNNSFKRAVQKSLPENEQPPQFRNVAEKSPPSRKDAAITQQKTPLDNPYPIYIPQNSDHLQRSNSVKVPSKKKSFNFKNILMFIPNATRNKDIKPNGKSDTFPLSQQPRYHASQGISNVNRTCFEPVALPLDMKNCEDPIIFDSTKRVLEWQMKNDDVISKENKIREQKISQTINTRKKKSKPFSLFMFGCCSAPGKEKTEAILSAKNTTSTRNPYPTNSSVKVYESIDGTLPSQNDTIKQKSNPSKSARINSHKSCGHSPPKNGVHSTSNRDAYQSSHSAKTPRSNDIYATINKVSKKDASLKSPSNMQPSAAPHPHIHKYRF